MVDTVERRIPKTFITRDLWNFADLLCCRITPPSIMLVQVTGGKSTSNFHARVAKIRKEARAGIWLASGGRIQVHSWEGVGAERTLRVFEIQTQHIETVWSNNYSPAWT